VQLVDDVNLHLSMGAAVIGVVDRLSEDLMIEGVIQSRREDLVESWEELALYIGWVYIGSCVVKHFLEVEEISVIKRFHPFEGEAVFGDVDLFDPLGGGEPPAEESSAEGELFVVCDVIGQD
jgi:hypothetical protein